MPDLNTDPKLNLNLTLTFPLKPSFNPQTAFGRSEDLTKFTFQKCPNFQGHSKTQMSPHKDRS